LLQEALAQRFVCGRLLMVLLVLIMQLALKVVILGFQCLLQAQASTGMQELRGLQD
jgi:cell division protein FtsL